MHQSALRLLQREAMGLHLGIKDSMRGAMRLLLSGCSGVPIRTVKIKAHREESSAVDSMDLTRIRGNAAADRAAALGTQQHPLPSRIETDEATSLWTLLKLQVQLAASVLPHWPTARALVGGRLARVAAGVGGGCRLVRAGPPVIPEDQRHLFLH